MSDTMLYVRESQEPIDAVCKKLESAVAVNKMGVLGVHNLAEKMKEKGVPFDRECRIYEICNPQQAKKVLEGEMAISTALPCRISVYQEGAMVKAATLKPTALMQMFGDSGLQPVAEEVESAIVRIIDAACQ